MSEGQALPAAPGATRALVLLQVGQIAQHAAMAGHRMAAPLQALDAGHSAWAVGLLLALFAALPVLIAMPAGRMADRHGYHRPQKLAVGLSFFGVGCALAACWLHGWAQFALQCLGAAASGAVRDRGFATWHSP
jgi:MFS family permease